MKPPYTSLDSERLCVVAFTIVSIFFILTLVVIGYVYLDDGLEPLRRQEEREFKETL